ncbi:MAG: hypothetical protein MSC30_15835 [Gaiellaceae bacterium MAG52_C11]|nr:hypothetical protein [Candidatus Gaiellasilicea maunaloa]
MAKFCRTAGQVDELAVVSDHLDVPHPSGGREPDAPFVGCTARPFQPYIGNASQAGLLANRALGGLDGERVTRAPAIVR